MPLTPALSSLKNSHNYYEKIKINLSKHEESMYLS